MRITIAISTPLTLMLLTLTHAVMAFETDHGQLTRIMNLLCVCVCVRVMKSPLKVQNGVPESPIKKVAKRSRQVLDSDEEEEEAPLVEDLVTEQETDKEVKREKVNVAMSVFGLVLLPW